MYKKIFYTLIICGLLVLLCSACGTPATTQAMPTATFVPPTPKPTATQATLTRPSANSYLLVYDPGRQQILFIGNLSSVTDMWAYDVTNQKLTRLKDKPGTDVRCLDYDTKAGGVIGFAKDSGKTWFYDPAQETWKELAKNLPDQNTWPGHPCNISYHPVLDKMLVITEAWPVNFTSFYDYATNTWTQNKFDPVPPLLDLPMVYDAESDRILVWDAAVIKRWWVFTASTSTWEKLTYTGGPEQGSWLASIVYVPDLDRTFTYLYNEFYAYDYNTNTWEQAKGELKPGNRIETSLAYDPVAKKIVLYGGYHSDGTTSSDDLWLYDPVTGEWTQQQLP